MPDALGFATTGSKKNPKAVSVSAGTQKDINAIAKNAGKLADVVGQGDDAEFKKFKAQQKKQKKQQDDQQVQVQQQQVQQQQKKNSLLSKVKKVAKTVGEAAITSEKTAATGIARTLPGGTADIQAETAASAQATKNLQQIKQAQKDGKIKPAAATKLIKLQASNAAENNKTNKKTVDDLPSKGEVLAGFGGTAADVLSGGSYGTVFKGAKAGRVFKGAELTKRTAEVNKAVEATRAAKAAKSGDLLNKVRKVGNVVGDAAPQIATNAAAGGFNAAAGGGDANEIVKNATVGAVVPEALHAGSSVTAKALRGIMDKVRAPKELIQNAKAQALLKTNTEQANKVAAEKTAKLDQQIELINAKKADGKFTNVDKVKVKQLQEQRAAFNPEQAPANADSVITPQTNDAPVTSAVPAPSNGVPIIKAYGRDIQLSKENGYEAHETGSGTIYKKVVRYGRNNKDSSLQTNYYDASGTKLTSEQAKAALKTKPVATPAANPITAEFDKHYKGGAKASPDEKKAAEFIRNDPEGAMSSYDARVKDKFGATNIVSGDESKYVIPGFDSTKSASYHEPASALAKVKYQQLLSDSATKDKPVLLMAGGSGSGKTSALKRLGINFDNYAAVIDTNTNKLEGATSRIDQALASGRHVQIFYVHRDPIKAFTHGVIPRGGKEGRIVPVKTHIETHYGSHETVQKLEQHYKDNPLVEVTAASNNHGHGKARELELDKVPQMKYSKEEIHQHLTKAVDHALEENKISAAERDLYHGKEPGAAVAKGPDSGTEPKRPAGQTRGPAESTQGSIAKTTSTGTRTLKPSETAHMAELGGYTHSEHMAQDYADMLRTQEKLSKGGQMVPDGEGGFKRTSEHSRFYRAIYKETGRPPTKADYLEEAKKQLETGKDGLGAGDDYKKLLEREAKPVERVKIESTVKDVPTGTSKVAERTAADIKERYGDLAQYDKINIKDQANKAEKVLTGDRDALDKIIAGDAPLPDGLRATSLVAAIRNDPVLGKDSAFLLKVAKSPLASESSYSAQELRLARENAKNDPVEAIKDLIKTRSKTLEKRSGKTATKAVSDEVLQIRRATPRVKKENWSDFLDGLKC